MNEKLEKARKSLECFALDKEDKVKLHEAAYAMLDIYEGADLLAIKAVNSEIYDILENIHNISYIRLCERIIVTPELLRAAIDKLKR